MYVQETEEARTIRLLKNLVQSESAAIAVLTELMRTTKNDELVELLAQGRDMHLQHKKKLEGFLQTVSVGPVAIQSQVPPSMKALIGSTTSNPRTPYAILQALETHMRETVGSFRNYNIAEVNFVADEQEKFTDNVEFVIQTLTRILPIRAVTG